MLSHRDMSQYDSHVRQADCLDPSREIVFSLRKHFGGGFFYKLEISLHLDNLFIAAFDVNSPESLLIEIPADKKAFILSHFNDGDYELMANCLKIDRTQKRLILLKPSDVSNNNS